MSGLDGALRMAVKGVAGGIGLASESITAYKQKKKKTERTRSDSSHRSRPSQDFEYRGDVPGTCSHRNRSHESHRNAEDGEILVDEHWRLDEAQDALVTGTPTWQTDEPEPERDVGQTIDMFLHNFPPPPYSEHAPLPRLQLPAILPQRRPKDRSRGFIRAYAPMLESCGIDQAAWFSFLDTFEKASKASPWLAAINLAAIATIHMPHVLSIVVGLAIQTAVKAAMEVQGRVRTNSFLDRINSEFFQPRGLYCLVLTWNPESDQTSEQVNLTSAITSTVHPGGSGIRNKLKSSSGKSYGDMAFPEAAPLIFPALDQLGSQSGNEAAGKRSKLKKRHAFVANYWDKRATAKYKGKNPDNLLAQVPEQKFTSRYADPNHPASSGSLVSLVTGGHVNPPQNSARGGFGAILGGLGGTMGDRGGRGVTGGRGGGLGVIMGGGMGGGFGSRGGGLGGIIGGGGFGGRQGLGGGRMGGDGMGDVLGGTRISRGGRITDDRDSTRGGGHLGGGIGGRGVGEVGIGGLPTLGGTAPLKKLFKKNVLYLMVVNMPSEEEMAEAMAERSR